MAAILKMAPKTTWALEMLVVTKLILQKCQKTFLPKRKLFWRIMGVQADIFYMSDYHSWDDYNVHVIDCYYDYLRIV